MSVPLDQWVEENGLEDLRDRNIKIHLQQWGHEGEDLEGLTRMIMISIRQELRENWGRVVRMDRDLTRTHCPPLRKDPPGVVE